MNVRNLENIQEKRLLFQRFVTSIVGTETYRSLTYRSLTYRSLTYVDVTNSQGKLLINAKIRAKIMELFVTYDHDIVVETFFLSIKFKIVVIFLRFLTRSYDCSLNNVNDA